MKPRWKIVIVAIILAATITLASLSYLWLTSGDVIIDHTPSAAVTKTNVTDGVRFSFISVSSWMTWGQVRIYVTEGLHVGHWEPSDRDFDGGRDNVTVVLRNITLGEQVIGCVIHDLGLWGRIGGGDEFTFSGSIGIYLVTLVHEPTGGVFFQDSFYIPIHK